MFSKPQTVMISFVPHSSHHWFTMLDRYQQLGLGKVWEWGTRHFDKKGIHLFDQYN